MSDTIRELIIQAILSKMEDIRTTAGYNTDIGSNVRRARKNLDNTELPACVVWPKLEETGRVYGAGKLSMPVQIEGLATYGTSNPSVVIEAMLGDIIEAMIGEEHTLAFTSGGTYEIEVGDTITGHTSGATGYVGGVTVASGTFAAGTAAGTLTLRRVTGTFQAENLDVGANANVATIAGNTSGSGPLTTTTGDYAANIQYAGGGISDYPDSNDPTAGVITSWIIQYDIVSGDPYHVTR